MLDRVSSIVESFTFTYKDVEVKMSLKMCLQAVMKEIICLYS